MSSRKVDVAIIGSGTAGMSAYREVRKHTDSIALIEGGPFGTTCARVGCMPSKLFIAPAEARHRLSVLPEFGIRTDAGEVDGAAVMQRVRDERDRFVGFVLDAVEGFDDEHVVRAHASFAGPNALELAAAWDGSAPPVDRIEARTIIIATGSDPTVPGVLKDAGERLIVSDDVFDWTELPRSVAVFGAGVIGLELGQALHRLGVRVRVFGRDGSIAGISDPEVRAYAAGLFAAELPMSIDSRDVALERADDGIDISFVDDDGERRRERFEYVLAATGRAPSVDRLGLGNSGLELGDKGLPVFDPQTGQAGDSHIFVAGDFNDFRPLLHEAADEGRLAGENAVRYPKVYRRTRRTPLGIVFSDPQVAFAGQRYAELVESGAEFESGEVSFEDQGRARVMLVNKGLLRIYGEHRTGLLLGAEMIGPHHEHVAHLLAWSIQSRLTVGEVLEMPFYHPVIEEGVRTGLRMLQKALGMGPMPPLRCIDCGPGG